MKKAKVAHLTTVHSALDNRIYHRECVSLARAGFDVTIVGLHPKDATVGGVRIKAIPHEEKRLLRATRGAWRAYREAAQEMTDLYHFHDPELIPVGLLLRAQGRKVIYDIHEDLPKDILSKHYLPLWSRTLVSWIAARFEHLASVFFSALVAATPTIADRFRPFNKRTVVVLNYPKPEAFVAASASSPRETRPNSVAYIGGITVNRGIREMVLAMAMLPESLSSVLELAGNEVPDDAHPEELRQLSGWKRVRHHGALEPSGITCLLSQARAGLALLRPVAAFLEAVPVKTFEYMAAGLPVIASNFPLWREVIEGVRCGIVVDPLDPRAIAKAIEYVLTHPAEAQEMGRRGQAAVLEQYNWESQERKLIELYTGLLEPVSADLPNRIARDFS